MIFGEVVYIVIYVHSNEKHTEACIFGVLLPVG